MKKISFKLNDFQYTINNKLTLIQACLKNKVDVPRFCFHEKLSIAGNCRMCLVEDLKQVKPVASCAINVSGGMSVYTNTLKVKKARESVLEFLLANHPLDCPICDQGGECDLQDQSIVFGSDRGRFYEFKRSVEDKDCGPLIKTIMNRCIHCTRCVRFSKEVAGVNVLGVTGRGSKMEIGFYIENLMRSELSGNIIDLCPVGALTSKPFAFTSRPWELKSYNSIDIFDNMNSNIRIDVRGTKIMRILPRVNQSINEDWITDKVRFSYDGLRRQRLYDPMILFKKAFVKISWKKTFTVLKNILIKSANLTNYLPLSSYIGDHLDIEALFMIKRFSSLSGSNYILNTGNLISDNRIVYSANTQLEDLSKSDICVLLGLNLRLQLPLLNSKIRQIAVKNETPVYLVGYNSNFNYYVKHISTSTVSLLNIIEGSHWLSSKLSKRFSKRPVLFLDDLFLSSALVNQFLRNTFLYTNLFSFDWVGFNLISSRSSHFSINELNFRSVNNQNKATLTQPVKWLLNYDLAVLKTNSYYIYQGHHGDVNASLANLVLPSTSFIEKNSIYANMWGVVQKTKKVLFSVGNSRDDWKIVNAIIEVLGFNSKKINTSFDLIALISKISPFVLYKATNFNIWENSLLNAFAFFHFKNGVSFINNYYVGDVITRNSKIMSLCANKFKLSSYNFFA